MAKTRHLKKQIKKTRNKRGGCPCNKKRNQSFWGGNKSQPINYTMDNRIIPV